MTQQQIQTAYRVALEHTTTTEEAVQVGIQMALNNGEIMFDDEGKIIMID